MQLKANQSGHPMDDLNSIFGEPDRVADYQHYVTGKARSELRTSALEESFVSFFYTVHCRRSSKCRGPS